MSFRKFLIDLSGNFEMRGAGWLLGLFESYRQQLLNVARLLFVVGVVVGFLSPFYSALERLYFLTVFSSVVPSFVSEVVFSFSAAILCVSCYLSLRKEKFAAVSFRGVVASAFLIVVGIWPAGLLVLGASIIASLYQAT